MEHVATYSGAAGENDISEKSLFFIYGERFHQWLSQPGNDKRRIGQVEQKCTEAIALRLIDAVVDLQPALFRLDHGRTAAYLSLIPPALRALQQNPVIAPVEQVG